MTSPSQSSLAASLDAEVALVPYLPELLQDLWALGFPPESALELLNNHGWNQARRCRVIDLGCGKGALLVALAKRFGWRGRGVDLVPEFIAEATRRSKEQGVDHLVTFEVADLCKEVEAGGEAEVVVFGNDTNALGPLEETLRSVGRLRTPDGIILFETAWTLDVDAQTGLSTEAHTRQSIELAGLHVTGSYVYDRNLVRACNASNTALISVRAEQIARRCPELSELLSGYVQAQREESAMLEDRAQCVCLLLTRAEH